MTRWLRPLGRPLGWLLGPLGRHFDARVQALLGPALQPLAVLPQLAAELRSLQAKTDRLLDLELAPDVLRDFRTHNITLRAIQADCDLLRELNPLVNSLLRDVMRLQARCDDLAWRLDQLAGAPPRMPNEAA